MSIGLVDIVRNTPTAVANGNTSGNAFPIACSATAPTTPTAVTSVDNPKAVINPVNTTANTPIDAIPIPRDFSALQSSAPNPWGSLRRRRYLRSHQSTHRRQYLPSTYPVNTYSKSTFSMKSPISSSIHAFETVRHPYGIGPTKPVIRVPVPSTDDILAPHSQPNVTQPISLSLPPPVHPTVAVRCHCGQLVRVSPASQLLQLPTKLQLLRSFPTYISNFFSYSFSLPSFFFSCFRLSMATRASP